MKGCVGMFLSLATLLMGLGVMIVGLSWAWNGVKTMFSKKNEDE